MYLTDIQTICHEELELKHDDINLSQDVLIEEDLVVELYNLKEGELLKNLIYVNNYQTKTFKTSLLCQKYFFV